MAKEELLEFPGVVTELLPNATFRVKLENEHEIIAHTAGRMRKNRIRVLAGGALSGSAERHPIAGPAPEPIGSAMSYNADIDRARRLMPLVEEGFAASLTEAATRFALSHPAMGTILVGMATPAEFEEALTAVNKGPLPRAALDGLAALQRGFAGETR